jgi:hypothetical protein
MRWITDGAPLDPLIERSSRLTRDELHALADRYDPRRSRVLREPVASDLGLGVALGLLPRQAFELCDVITDVATRSGMSATHALRVWEAVADAMIARLFPQLPPTSARELERLWAEVVSEDRRAA